MLALRHLEHFVASGTSTFLVTQQQRERCPTSSCCRRSFNCNLLSQESKYFYLNEEKMGRVFIGAVKVLKKFSHNNYWSTLKIKIPNL